jgi:hypothetical protein
VNEVKEDFIKSIERMDEEQLIKILFKTTIKYFKINDNSTTPPSVVTAQLTPTGFENIIKFKPGVAVLNSVVNGAVPTQ